MVSRLQTGTYTLQAAIVDSSDFPIGQLITPDNPTHGTVYAPYLVKSAVSYAAADDTVESVNSFGGQRVRGKRDLGTSELGDGTLELSEYDADFDALVQGFVKDTTTGTGLEITGHNANRGRPRRFMLAFTAAATPVNSAPNYDTIFTWGTLRRGALATNQGSGRNPNNRVYTLTRYLSPRTPWGQLFSSAAVAPDGGSDDETTIYADAPMEFFTVVRDGTASGYVAPYAFSYTAVAAFGSANLLFMNGTASAQLAASFSGGTALLVGNAGTSGQKLLVMGPSQALLNA